MGKRGGRVPSPRPRSGSAFLRQALRNGEGEIASEEIAQSALLRSSTQRGTESPGWIGLPDRGSAQHAKGCQVGPPSGRKAISRSSPYRRVLRGGFEGDPPLRVEAVRRRIARSAA